MPKVYRDINVYEAAMKRYEIMFSQMDHIYFSVSGGKDSSVMVQLAARKAREMGKRFSVLYIDLEAQYAATIDHIYTLIEEVQDVLDAWYWIALPLSLRNAVSVIQPKWICWDKKDKEKWVREMPDNPYVINEDTLPEEWKSWFFRGMEFEEFILFFAEWFAETYGGRIGAGIGIRSDESLNRFRTIVSESKVRYQDYSWTTQVQFHSKALPVYNFYPLYDWRTEDDWIAVAKFKLKFNQIYELMNKNGLSIHEQRLCQPYGDDQRNGLDQFRALEPETWEKVLHRVHGVNYGNIYARTSLLGNLKTMKPDFMSWEQYSVFLLESLGLYAPELREHYYKKIKTFFAWYQKTEGLQVADIKEEEDLKLENAKKVASWRRIARAIERNDFWMKRLSFGQTKGDVQKLFELKKKYANIIRGEDTDDKQLRAVAAEVNFKMIRVFEGAYDRGEFYSLMGKFFAEPEYQKRLPYLVNRDNMVWFVLLEGGLPRAFCSAEIHRNRINFAADFYEEKIEDLECLFEEKINALTGKLLPMETATAYDAIQKLYEMYGFVEKRRTSNYTFLRKEASYGTDVAGSCE